MTSISSQLKSMVRLVASVATLATAAQVASAAPFTFNTPGGGTVTVTTIDETPGNVLAVNAQTVIQNAINSGANTSAPFTAYYQANVLLEDANGRPLNIGNGQITAVAKFNEVATNITAGAANNQVNFQLAADQTGSTFQFYFNPTAVSNNAAGTGFTAGQVIYTGSFVAGTPAGQFQVFPTQGTTALDQNNPSDPRQTVRGSGSTVLNIVTQSFNSSFFTSGLSVGSLLNFTSTNQTPFGSAPPSAQFTDPTNGAIITPSLPAVNGQFQTGGPARQDFQFLADGNSFFTAPIPEPASVVMTVLGLGGMGLGTVVARRRRATA